MTLEKLLGLSADDWEKLSDEELDSWAKQFHHITRPIKSAQVKVEKSSTKRSYSQDNLVKQALAMAEKLGITPKTK